MTLPGGFRDRCQALLDQAGDRGWVLEAEQAIPYGRLFRLASGTARATLSCYHGKRGFKHVVAGKDGDALRVVFGDAPASARSDAVQSDDPFGGGLPRVGADESGKGDYFGPLVVAAFYVDADTHASLRKLGVDDSKRLSRQQALRLAGALDGLDRGHVMTLHPDEYTDRHAAVGNLNVLLAQMHGSCISALLARARDEGWDEPQSVVVDRFATNEEPLNRAMKRSAETRLIARPKAEADAAVAAASILARAAFLEGLQALEQQYGMPFPPGAGTPVLKAGKAFVNAFGRDELRRVAKIHFATTKQL